VLRDLISEEQLSYTLVDPHQSDPTRGKLSIASPIGKALLHRKEDDVIEIAIPSGKLRYHIEQIWAFK
jgi:transcription elongation factor GreA